MAGRTSGSRQVDARVVGVLWRLPPELWAEPVTAVPAAWRRRLDGMDPAALRGLLIEVVHRLERADHAPGAHPVLPESPGSAGGSPPPRE